MVEVITVDHLTKYHHTTCVLHDLSFSVQSGEVFGLLGPDGAGKTTLLRTLLGFLKPDTGCIRLFDLQVPNHSSVINTDIGYISNQVSFYRYVTGYQMLSYLSKLRGNALYAFDELVHLFEIPLHEKIHRYHPELKQKLNIIQAFMHEPAVVLMDDPVRLLNDEDRKIFFSLLAEQKKKGATMVFASGDFDELALICDRIGLLHNGVLLVVDTVEGLRKTKDTLLAPGKNDGQTCLSAGEHV
ncbi:MAG: ABC transporter ATP-binding protein [Candidatus Thermoplasmatota archaeon]